MVKLKFRKWIIEIGKFYMERTIWIIACLMMFGCSCTSSEEKHLKILMNEMGIEFTNLSDSNYIIVIPGNGCGSCIQDAIDEIKEYEDTAYVFVCDSEKDFYLQSGGKKVSSFKNLYLDKKKITAQLEMIKTYPNVYLLNNGRLVSTTPYKSKRKLGTKQLQTTISIDKDCIDFGEIEFGNTYRDSIRIVNTGKEPLHINGLHSSCECTEVKYDSKVIPPSGYGTLHVIFRPDIKGEIERLIFIDCNVKEKSLEIPVKGIVY